MLFYIGEILGFVGKILDVKDYSHSGEPLGTSQDQFYPSLQYKISRFLILIENQFEEFMIQNGAYRRWAVRVRK